MGQHNIANALAAYAAASLFDIEPNVAADVFATLQPVALRGECIRFVEGFTVINDAYNANPRAVQIMAETISRTPSFQRRRLLIGEMAELGPTGPALHRQTGAHIATLGNIDFLAGVTGLASELVAGAVAAGLPPARTQFFETKEAAAEWLCQTVRPGDLVLLKASRVVALETLLEALKTKFETEATFAARTN